MRGPQGLLVLRWNHCRLGGPQSSWRNSEAAEREATEIASMTAGKASKAAGRGSEAAWRASEATQRALEEL